MKPNTCVAGLAFARSYLYRFRMSPEKSHGHTGPAFATRA
jgi:hypothetical protein